MKTRNLTLLTFLLLLLTSCMPDSFTKFKEDPPKKESAGGATTAGGSDGTTAGSTTGSTTGTTTGGEEEETEDVQYEIKSVGFYQSEGDILVFEVADGADFSLDDVINVSNDLFGGGTINDQMGTIVAVHGNEGGGDSRILAVRLDGADAVDYDDNFSPDPTISIYNNDLTNEPEDSFAPGYFIDNCAAGYGACGNGTYAISTIVSNVGFLVNSGFPAADVTPNGARKNLHKRVKVVREPGALSASVARFDYSFSGGVAINGLGFEDSCDNNPANPLCNGRTDDNTADNDRLVSPYGPFALSAGTAFDVDNPLTVTVSLHEDFYGEALDPEEQGSAQIAIYTEVPGTPIEEIQQFRLGYYLPSGQRFAVKVDNATGYAVGHTIRSCRSNLTTNCNADTSNFVEGKAVVDYVDLSNDTIYLAAQDFNGRSSEFSNGRFLYNADTGTFRSQTTNAHFLVKAEGATAITIPKEWNDPTDATDDPEDALGNPIVFSYLVDEAPTTGFSVDANGDIQIVNPSVGIDNSVTISAQHPTTGEIVASYTLTFDFITTPSALRFSDLNSSKTIQTGINEEVEEDLVVTSALNFEGHSTDGEINVGFLEIRQPNPLPGGETPLPASVSIDNGERRITFAPGDFVDGSASYTIEALHPAWDPSTPVVGTISASFSSATSFDLVTFDQNSGDRLIITTEDLSGFSGDTSFEVGDNISTQDGARATIDYIDEERGRFYITVTASNNGFTGFKPGDSLDKTDTFILARKRITDDATSVVRVYDISDTVLDQGNGIVPVTRKEDGTLVSPAVGETFTYSITPALPSDLTIAATPVGAIVQTDPVVGNNPAGLPETIYTLAVTNGNGETALATIVLSLSESLSSPGMSRYQIVKLSSGGDRFYRGTKFATGGSGSITGRVLLPLDTDEDGEKDALLVEGNGLIPDNVGIDNSAKYFASEGTSVPHRFWYVKDATDFDIGDTVTSNNGSQAEIVAVDSANDRLYVKINNGTFDVGTEITEDDVSSTTTITNAQTYHFVTGVIEVSSGDFASFTVGAPVSGAGGSEGIVVQKHRGNNNTTLLTDDRYFILVQHTGGPNFFEGQTLNGSATALAMVGPVVNLNITGGGFTDSSSSGRLDRNGNPFFEGNMIGGFSTAPGEAYQSIGFAVHGTDYTAGDVTVAVEDFDNPFTQTATYIDDFSESQTAVRAGETHNRVNGVELSNLVIGYVGEDFYLQPAVKGNFNYATISPEALPDGLSFNSLTGVISGLPTEGMSGQNYTITYRKSDNTGVTYTFPFVIYNQFEIAHLTDNASSYVLHREGQGLGTSNCKVFGPQLIDDPTDPNYNQAIYGLNDIVCLFEGGESDLFNQGIDFDIKAGNGMCEYVQYVPFSYQGFLPGSSNREIVIYEEFADADQCDDGADLETMTGPAGYVTSGNAALFASGFAMAGRAFGGTYCQSGDCISSQEATTACSYDYSQYDPTFPNLDSGTITTRTVSCSHEEGEDSDDPADGTPDTRRCVCTISEPTRIECGGSQLNGLAGAKRSSDLDVSEAGIIVQSYNGLLSGSTTQTITSPIDRGYGSNRYIANFVNTRNYADDPTRSCIASPYHMDKYNGVGTLERNDINPSGAAVAGNNNRTSWDNFSSRFDPFGQSVSGAYSNYYTFNCLDAGYDIKARIRVLVRDWDREFLPEDHAVSSLINGMADTNSLTGNPQISISAGSHNATLTASVSSDEAVIGLGSLIYLESGATAGLQTDEDLLVEVARYDGTTGIILKAAAGMNLGPVDFYLRSKQDDDATNSFDNNYDNRADHDSVWNWIDELSTAIVPNYQFCGDNLISDMPEDEFNPGSTISMAAGTNIATLSAPLAGAPTAELIPYGSVVEITDGANRLYFMVVSASGNTIVFMNDVSYTLGAGATWRVIRRIPFPAEAI